MGQPPHQDMQTLALAGNPDRSPLRFAERSGSTAAVPGTLE
jgi:hypothetical protein